MFASSIVAAGPDLSASYRAPTPAGRETWATSVIQSVIGVVSAIRLGRRTERGVAAPGRRETGLPPSPSVSSRRGDIEVFTDELTASMREVAAAHAVFLQFRGFCAVVRKTHLLERAARRRDYAKKISLFALGALLTIDSQIDLRSERGKALVHDCLELFVRTHGSVPAFTRALAVYMGDPAAASILRAGAQSYRFYTDARLRALTELFGETFGLYEPLEPILGGAVNVGVLFTDIVDSTGLTSALGDVGAQEIVKHHEALVAQLLPRYGGRQVKHLGDGLMLSFGRAERMTGFASALIRAHSIAQREPDTNRYSIRVGGHFGPALRREGDFFGATIHMAARICDTARANQARFCTSLVADSAATQSRYELVETAALRGFERRVSLSGYRV